MEKPIAYYNLTRLGIINFGEEFNRKGEKDDLKSSECFYSSRITE